MTVLSLVLCIVYTIYLVFGGIIFTYLEYEVIEETILEAHPAWNRLKELALASRPPNIEDELTGLIGWLQKECADNLPAGVSLQLTTVGNQSKVIDEIQSSCFTLTNIITTSVYHYPWSFIDSLYFSMTVITTIGYGHISPTTKEGKIGCILYSLIGIPLTLVLMARTSKFFGKRLFDLFTSKVDASKQRSKIGIAMGTFFYISLGFVVFIFLPAVLFTYTENWAYLDSVYYAYITLTTIGFGDFVTGKNMADPWLTVYQIGVTLWIIAGLGYWVMVANFMVLALKSKKVYAMAKRVTELKKVVSQFNGNQHDPEFLTKSSKTSVNFLLQLASALAVPDMADIPVGSMLGTDSPKAPNPALKRPAIPGIAALFNASRAGGTPMFHNMLPEVGKNNDQSQNKPTLANKSKTIQLDDKQDLNEEENSNVPSDSLYLNSPLSTSSEFLSENEISSYSLLSEAEALSCTQQEKCENKNYDPIDQHIDQVNYNKDSSVTPINIDTMDVGHFTSIKTHL